MASSFELDCSVEKNRFWECGNGFANFACHKEDILPECLTNCGFFYE